jgi:invasion protein IalB
MLARAAIVLCLLALGISRACAGIDEDFVRPGGGVWGDVLDRLLGQKGFGKSYALVIGVGNYDYYTKLSAPAADAEQMRNFLRDEGQFDRIITLTDEKATRARIESLMDRILPQLVQGNDRFLFYFSGHGMTRNLAASKRGYLILKSSRRDSWDEMIDMPRIREWAENFGNARHVLFLLDACFSGLAAAERKVGLDPKNQTIQRLMQPASHIVTAGVEGEESYIVDGKSLFTSAFLTAARGSLSSSNDGVISLSEIMVQINRVLDFQRAKLNDRFKMTPRNYYARIENNAGEFFFLPAGIQRSAKATPGSPSAPEVTSKSPNPKAPPDLGEQPNLLFSAWSKSCAMSRETNGKQTCTTSKEGRVDSGATVVAAELVERQGDSKTLRVSLPLGMSIQPGTRVIVDDGQPINAAYTGCFADGCVAEYAVSDGLLAKLKNGNGLAVQGINGAGQPISLVLPLANFAQAYDGRPSMPQITAQSKREPAAPLDAQQLIFSPWTRFCLKGQEQNAKQVCFTGKDGRVESGLPVAAAVVIEPENEPRKLLRVTLPLGMSIQPGTRAMIDNGQPMTGPYVICFNNGCMADYEASGALITALKKGRNLFIGGINTAGQSITVAIPLTEFAKAFDGPPTDPKAFEAQQIQLQEELQRRAEGARGRAR